MSELYINTGRNRIDIKIKVHVDFNDCYSLTNGILVSCTMYYSKNC